MLRKYDIFLIVGILLLIIGVCYFGIVHGMSRRGLEERSNSTSNMTLQCVRMFYSDSWDKGYVVDLAKFCDGKDIG
jgi:hypothetical protein